MIFFLVPKVIDEGTTGKVLTTEWADGRPLSRMKTMSQATKDKVTALSLPLISPFFLSSQIRLN